MGTKVGGSPELISAGASQIAKVATAVTGTSTGFSASGSQASGAAGNAALSGAMDRYRAAFTGYSADLAAQLSAAALLAQHSAEDLQTAGGGHIGGPQ